MSFLEGIESIDSSLSSVSLESEVAKTFPSKDSEVVEAENQDKVAKPTPKLALSELVEAIISARSEGKLDKDQVRRAMESYDFELNEWKRYEFWESKKCYTRNLIATDYETFALMLLCWNPGKFSPVHSHAGSECFLKSVQGSVHEVQFEWPEKDSSEKEELKVQTEMDVKLGEVAWINDSVGIHKVGNSSDKPAVTLHCYMPPYETCKIFPLQHCKAVSCTSTFYSEMGVKIEDDM